MSSGELPLGTYHRAQRLGSGSYGDVLTVYDENGQELAIKLFIPDEDEVDDNSSSNTNNAPPSMDLGAQREISILRLLRCENSHPNIIEIIDLKQKDDLIDDEEYTTNDEQMCNTGIIMPLYPHGNLSDAIDGSLVSKKVSKIRIAHGVLSAVAYLHSNGIIHRDIKGDNIMLDYDESTGDFIPILIDFSLAKVIQPQMFQGPEQVAKFMSEIENETTHTPTVGTPTYKGN